MGNPILQMLGMTNNNNNTTGFIQMMMSAKSPQQMLAMMVQQYPESQQLIYQLGSNPTPQSMQKLCEQLCQKRGMDLNTVLNQAQQIVKNMKF